MKQEREREWGRELKVLRIEQQMVPVGQMSSASSVCSNVSGIAGDLLSVHALEFEM